MPSRPVQAFFEKQMAELGGWESIFERIANGESQTDIANGFGVSQGWLSRIINQDPERKLAFRQAKREAAQAYADECKRIADGMPLERDAIAKGREQIAVRRWLATVYDREQFGEPDPSLNVTVNVEHMHLNALRHRTIEASKPLEEALAVSARSAFQVGDGSAEQTAQHDHHAGVEYGQPADAA